jgi:glycogen operon protein
MSDDDWNAGYVKCLGVRLAGDLINDENERGEPIVGDTLLLLLNAHWEPIPFALPQTREGHIWDPILDTADLSEDVRLLEGGDQYPLRDRSLAVLVARTSQEKGQIVPSSQVHAVLAETRSSTAPPGPSPI